MDEERCGGCGLAIEGGERGCQRVMDELLARDFADPLYFGVHRLMVDTYSLQHPDRYCVSAKSLAAHLAGLCSIVERGASRAVGAEALRRWLDGPGPRGLGKPAIPAARGPLTIADVRGAPDPAAYAAAVDRWARATWEAYAPLHAVAREWTRAALARG